MNILTRLIGKTANILTFGGLSKEFERAYFEGAKSTRLNRDFNVSNNHFELQAGQDRDMLKARARWLSSNNPITKSIDKSIIKNVVGIGISLQSKVKSEDFKGAEIFNVQIEELWKEFCKKENFDISGRFSFYKFQKLILKHKMVDGEVLINKIFTKDKKFPLKFQLIESDQFDTRITKYKKNDVFSGVEVNNIGKKVAYHLKTSINSTNSKRFDEKNIIHYLDEERATQYRGISEYAQTINNLKDFSAYNDSEIIKNRILSNFALFIETEDKARSLAQDTLRGKKNNSLEPIKEITAGMIKYLRKGEKAQVVQSNQLGTNYNDFILNTVRLIAVGRDISYELAFRDYTKTNFSSARASLIQDNKRFDEEQKLLISDVLNPIFEDFVDSQVLNGNVKIPFDYWQQKQKYIKPSWTLPRRDWVDPIKDIKTIEKEIELGITTRTKATASKGQNFEDNIDEKIKEEIMIREKRKKANLPIEEEKEENNGKKRKK